MTTQQDHQQDHLYQLLPVIHRLRDHEQGEPLRNLLQVIAEQVTIVEDDIQQIYDNWFIETCEDWVVPYIGDLIGYTSLFEAGEPTGPLTTQAQTRNKILVPRREVANTIRYRRRKGSLALLEQLASDVAGWRAYAVEFYTRLSWTQHLNHQRLERGRIVDLRNSNALELLDGPFDTHAHTVDVRRPNSIHTSGRHNIPIVGLFVWRLKSYSVTQTQACCLEDVGTNCYTFSALGNDNSLYVKSHASQKSLQIGGEVTAPVPIRRRAFTKPRSADDKGPFQVSESFYGDAKSLAIWADNWPAKNARALDQPIPPSQIIPADLSEWQSQPPKDCIAVDPLLGRIVFPPSQRPKGGVRVSYHYGFSADIGGGEYLRTISQPTGAVLYRVVEKPQPEKNEFASLTEALDHWRKATPYPKDTVVEIAISHIFEEKMEALETQTGQTLQVRAASGYRPVLRLQNFRVDLPDAWTFRLAPGSQVTLEGLLLYERGVFVEGPSPVAQNVGKDSKEQKSIESSSTQLDDNKRTQQNSCTDNTLHLLQPQAQFTIRHCTLVPGWQLMHNCEPKRPCEPSLQIAYVNARFQIEQSIIGSIMVVQDAVANEPTLIYISDSIVDATSSGGEGAESTALSDNELSFAHATLTIRDSTVFGKVMTHAIDLAENTIFDDIMRVVRSQRGCMRFSYITPDSRTPRRINCQPDLVEQPVRMDHQTGKLGEEEYKRCLERARRGVRPSFNSRRYGMPTYCQLADACPEEITRGADDESEMGVFHDLYQPQRLANLQARLDEYTPAGMDAGIILVN